VITNIEHANPYEDEFEVYFLVESETYYKLKSIEFLSMNSCKEYIEKVEERFDEEIARVANYLSSSTEVKIKTILERELISTHAKTLLEMDNSGLFYMLDNHKLDDLRKLYHLFSRVSTSLDLLREYLGKYIENKGFDILNGQETSKDPILFVKMILELKENFDEINSIAFHNEKKIQKKCKESFEIFINKDHRTASYLANYIDDLFKKDADLQTSNEEEIERKLEKVLVIFRYLTDKDIFENYYKTLLSKRLLSGKSVSDEIERNMIAKLKAECGYQFTSKLEGMFMDMNISKNNMEDFRRSPYCQAPPIAMDIQLLTTGYWPLQAPTTPIEFPHPLSECCRRFTAYYSERNSGRKLTWIPQSGSVDIKVKSCLPHSSRRHYLTLALTIGILCHR
jgi:cullin 3